MESDLITWQRCPDCGRVVELFSGELVRHLVAELPTAKVCQKGTGQFKAVRYWPAYLEYVYFSPQNETNQNETKGTR